MIYSEFNNIKISGITCVVPPKKEVLKEKYLDVFGETAIKNFEKMTGVVSRHITSSEQTASDLAYEAAEYLIVKNGLPRDSIGALILVTQTPDYRIPATACVIHKRLKLSKDCVVFDVNLGCSGYVYGLQILSSIMTNSNISYGLLLVADTSNKTIAPNDRASCMLFGEAGAATLLEKTNEASPIKFGLRTDGDGFKAIIVPAGAYRNMNASRERTLWGDDNERSDFDLYMNGTDVFTFTITEVPRLLKDFMVHTKTSDLDYDCFPFHQANLFILKQLAKRAKLPIEKMPISIDRFGNTSVTSIPSTIADFYGDATEIKTNENEKVKMLMCGFGVGLSWGAVSAEMERKHIDPIIYSDEFYKDGAVSHV